MTSYKPINLAFRIYEPTEKSELPDILMIHGVMSSKDGWDKIAKSIADRSKRRVYALDMRNHGESEWSDSFNYDVMVKDVVHFMEEKQIKKASFIGHSMGGKVALLLATVAPEKIEKLIVEDSVPKTPTKTIRDMIAAYLGIHMKSIQSIPVGADLDTAEKSVIGFLSQHLPKGSVRYVNFSSFVACKDGTYTWIPNLPVLKKFISEVIVEIPPSTSFEKPTLFIYGTLSPFNVYQEKDYILNHFPKAKFQAIENATHLVHFEYPEEFSNFVINFFKSSED